MLNLKLCQAYYHARSDGPTPNPRWRVGRGSFHLVGDRIYGLEADVMVDRAGSPDIARFFDSFVLVGCHD